MREIEIERERDAANVREQDIENEREGDAEREIERDRDREIEIERNAASMRSPSRTPSGKIVSSSWSLRGERCGLRVYGLGCRV